MKLWPAALVIPEHLFVMRCFGQLVSELTCPASHPLSGDRLPAVEHAAMELACLR